MAGLLSKAGFELVDSIEDAYIVIINCCTVKGNSNIIRNLRKVVNEYPHKLIILTGCVTDSLLAESREIKHELSSLNTHNIKEIVSVVEETLNENYIDILDKPDKCEKKINLPKIRKNKLISIIPISTGCISACSYCSVRLIKGELFSYPIESIVQEVKESVRDGCKEIWITSQDTAVYGVDWDGNSHLPKLLKSILAIEGNFMVRLGMGNAQHFMLIAEELAEIMKERKMFKFIHIPLQSGNDEILTAMNRKYTLEDFMKLIGIIKRSISNITISTDIICGYPEETDEQFRDSIKAIDKLHPDILNISRYNARLGTHAATLKQVPGNVIKDRSRLITSQFDWIGFDCNKKWKGWEGTILIDAKGKDDSWIGRNAYYRPVIVRGDYQLGDMIKVIVTDITKHYLIAEKVN